MLVLVVNCGSSSVKYQLMDTSKGDVLARGSVERIGLEDSVLVHSKKHAPTARQFVEIGNHEDAVIKSIESLVSGDKVIESLSEIKAVGHRFVHGGDKFTGSVVVDRTVLGRLTEIAELAPLHNPANILGIEAAMAVMPGIPQVAVFDTAFHSTIPPKAYMYAIPREYYEKYAIRKYGFHGTSHFYVSRRAAELMGKKPEETKLITCHLGNGCSIDAVLNGQAVDTSMGFTPLEGLMMGTRTGDIDAAAVLHIMKKENLSAEEMDDILNKKSGLLGMSGISFDMREIIFARKKGDRNADVALEAYCYRVKKYIAAYAGVLGGVDALIFTAGVGEHNSIVRELCCGGLSFMGIELDKNRNESAVGGEYEIGKEGAGTRVFVIPTNEEIVIAREAERLCSGK